MTVIGFQLRRFRGEASRLQGVLSRHPPNPSAYFDSAFLCLFGKEMRGIRQYFADHEFGEMGRKRPSLNYGRAPVRILDFLNAIGTPVALP